MHGIGLFFDAYLYVRNNAENIGIGDDRMVVVPIDWEWPQESAGIWTVYPYDGNKGIQSGDPPTFIGDWYNVPLSANKWTP